LEECRQNLADAVDGWVLIRLARGLPIPPIGHIQIMLPKELPVA
jgi:predicted RNase H-like HicB family nuclease